MTALKRAYVGMPSKNQNVSGIIMYSNFFLNLPNEWFLPLAAIITYKY